MIHSIHKFSTIICGNAIAEISEAAPDTVLLYFFAVPLQPFEKFFAIHFQPLPFRTSQRFLDNIWYGD